MFCRNCGNEIDDDAKFCKHCGQSSTTEEMPIMQQPVQAYPPGFVSTTQSSPYQPQLTINHQVEVVHTHTGAETTRLVIGIISIVVFLLVFLQSCAASCAEAIDGQDKTSGVSGIIVALFLLISGIISIAARKSKGGTITAVIFYLLAGLVGLAGDGIFKDLVVFWSVISFIFAGIEILSLIFGRKSQSRITYQ